MRASAAVSWASARLNSPAEAQTLVAHVLDVPASQLPLTDFPDTALLLLEMLVARRLEGEPLQHITGVAAFRSIDVEVGPGVFIPRPETELLAEWALERLREQAARQTGRRFAPAVVVELCAGSGAITKALASEFTGAEYVAVELSETAWPYLERNLAGTGARCVLGDMATALPELDGVVDLIVVNPPYVPLAVRDELPADVRHDPDTALFSGVDGLDALRLLPAIGRRLLRPGGWLGAEHDDTHRTAAPALFAASGFSEVTDHDDLAGRPRFVTARWPGAEPSAEPGRMTP